MATYRAPLDDFCFLLDELAPSLLGSKGRCRWSDDGDVLRGFARFCEEALEPLNRPGDEAGCRLLGGKVQTPAGFREAYDRFRDSGWPGVSEGDDDSSVSTAAAFCMDEMLGSANLAFSNYLGPTKRVVQVLAQQADEGLRGAYLEKLRSGRFTGTLCLTEPQCGTDLGLVATRAAPLGGNGQYRITGGKIFVTSGDHDLADNIVHLVLARIDGAPAGPRGLSLFVVPKVLETGEANAVVCAGIEHKMGIRASATCSLQFEGARGHLIGAPGAGLKAIFPAMEGERLVIALQSLGLAEHALQKARAYAVERLQGRAATGALEPDRPADPILAHADVRRMLLTMRANAEGGRALLGWVAAHVDLARREPDPAARQAALDFVLLMTPMLKAFLTDLGVETTNLGIQVFGGHGYIRESGVEQLARDARVTPLYAGANGIQALDLIQRKLAARGGEMIELFLQPARDSMEAWRGSRHAQAYLPPAREALEKLARATEWLARQGPSDPNLAGAIGADFVHLFGHAALSVVWAQTALLSHRKLEERREESRLLEGKIATATFYLRRSGPNLERLLQSVMAGSDAVMRPRAGAI